jgi:hypothetical protein
MGLDSSLINTQGSLNVLALTTDFVRVRIQLFCCAAQTCILRKRDQAGSGELLRKTTKLLATKSWLPGFDG